MKIPLSNPDITSQEVKAVVNVLKTSDLSLGPKLAEFEKKFASYIGTKYAIAVNSGTSGLHLCIRALGIKDGDEVITTPFSFIASANSILFERAKPVFVDIREDTWNIDETKIESKIRKKTKAVLPVHIFGVPCEIEKIMKIARRHNMVVIEDACESIGAEYKNKKAGSFGDCAVFGFYPNKQITTGEGGMIVSDDKNIARLCLSMRNQGRDEGMKWLSHNRLGYNYRLSDINCALGIAQLNRIDELLEKREKVALHYHELLQNIEEIEIPISNTDIFKRSYFVYVIKLKDRFTCQQRDEIIIRMRKKGIGCNSYFPAIHLQTFYQRQFGYHKGDFPVTEGISDRTIALPFYNNLREKQVQQVVKILKNVIREVQR